MHDLRDLAYLRLALHLQVTQESFISGLAGRSGSQVSLSLSENFTSGSLTRLVIVDVAVVDLKFMESG